MTQCPWSLFLSVWPSANDDLFPAVLPKLWWRSSSGSERAHNQSIQQSYPLMEGISKEQMYYPIRFHASISFSMILLNHEGAAGVTDSSAERNLGDHLSSIFVLGIRKMEFWPIKSQIAHKWYSWDQNSSSYDSQGHLPRNEVPFWELEILLADWRIKWNQ